MGEVAAKYAEDHEAQIFYALAIAHRKIPADKTYAGRLKAGAILEQLFAEEPAHPGLAHYIIHTYDVPALAGRALVAARRYSEIAPDAPHALHMPSHTFTRTGYWQESIDSNIAAAAAARREGQTAEELHASDYEIYAYLQTGQDQAARRILDSLPEIASRFDPKAVIRERAGPPVGYFALAAIPARYALETPGLEAGSAAHRARDTVSTYRSNDVVCAWTRRGATGAGASGERVGAALQHIRERLSKAGENYWALQVEIQEVAVRAWAALADGKKDEALRQMTFGGGTGRWDGEKRSDAWSAGPGARVAGRDVAGDE